MAVTENKQLFICLVRYSSGLYGDCRCADTLTKTLCFEKGLWTQFCQGVIKNHGRITREQIRTKILGFLCSQVQKSIDLCQRGENRLHDIHSDVEACQYFLIIFCGPKPKHELIGELGKVSSDELNMVLPLTNQILGINGDQIRELVIQFGRGYVERCRAGHISEIHDLVLLGGDFEFDIEEVGSSAAEVQQWLYSANLKEANNAYTSLMQKPLHELMADSENTAQRVQIVSNCLEPDETMCREEGLPWFMRTRQITADDLRLKSEDLEYLQRLQRELEARPLP